MPVVCWPFKGVDVEDVEQILIRATKWKILEAHKKWLIFYRAMHSAKHGIATLPDRLSVCNVEVPWSYRFVTSKVITRIISLGSLLLGAPTLAIWSKGIIPRFRWNKGIWPFKFKIYLYRQRHNNWTARHNGHIRMPVSSSQRKAVTSWPFVIWRVEFEHFVECTCVNLKTILNY